MPAVRPADLTPTEAELLVLLAKRKSPGEPLPDPPVEGEPTPGFLDDVAAMQERAEKLMRKHGVWPKGARKGRKVAYDLPLVAATEKVAQRMLDMETLHRLGLAEKPNDQLTAEGLLLARRLGQPAPAAGNRPAKDKAWLARALLKVQEHAECSDAEIARAVGVHPSTLCRSDTYKVGARLARAQGERPRGHLGRDRAGDGLHLEAEDPAE